MERVNQILENELYRKCYKKIEKCEKKREFCRHNMVHFMDVARIAYIYNLEEQLDIKKDVVYAAALLHDIGRFKQYEDKTPHEKASLKYAPVILKESGYSKEESEVILEAIAQHRNKEVAKEHSFRGIFYRADKASRACFSCKSEAECNWKNEKKNLELLV